MLQPSPWCSSNLPTYLLGSRTQLQDSPSTYNLQLLPFTFKFLLILQPLPNENLGRQRRPTPSWVQDALDASGLVAKLRLMHGSDWTLSTTNVKSSTYPTNISLKDVQTSIGISIWEPLFPVWNSKLQPVKCSPCYPYFHGMVAFSKPCPKMCGQTLG